jgi:excisionase family DNA binding protein
MSAVTQVREDVALDDRGLRPVQAVSEFLSLSRSKVYQLMETGKLPYVKIGKSRRVRWCDVLKLVDENTITRDAG